MDLTLFYAIPPWITAIVVVLAAFYLFENDITLHFSASYCTWNFGFLEKQGVKTKRPLPIIGSMNLKEAIIDFDSKLYKKFGRVYGYYEGRQPVLHIAEPDLIKQITVKDFWAFPHGRTFPINKNEAIFNNFLTNLQGEEWKRLRSVVSPTFTTGKLKQMSLLIEDCCRTLLENLNKYAESGEPVETKKCMAAFSLDVVASCAFGTKIDCLANPDNPFLHHAQEIFSPKIPKAALLIFFFPFLARFTTISFFPESSMNFLKNMIERVVSMRKNNKYPRDFLALLLEALSETEEQGETTQPKELKSNKKGVTMDLLIAQSILFLIAGHETTSTLLSFMLYCLALNPDVQDKLAAEVDRVMAKNNGKINYESVAEMAYIDMVVSETLRMYPPALRAERTCEEDNYEIAGVKLRKGMMVGIPVYCIHHDPENYPDPEKFIPERFSSENKANRNPFVYLPFGAGPRNCVAMRFALLEAKMTLAYIISEFAVKKCSQTETKVQFVPARPLLQPLSLTVAIEKRTKN